MTLHSERGAVLIQVAVAILALLALASFAIDQGFMWTARGQAQNAADAGAMAGALSLVNGQGTAHAATAARAVAVRNGVGGDALTAAQVVVEAVPLNCPTPFDSPVSPSCVKVNINKQNVRTFFGRLANVNTQGVQATATGMAGAGNATNCLKPWMIPDRYNETATSGPASRTFNPPADTYTPPGYTLAHVGTVLTLKEGNARQAISPSDFYIIGDANTYRDAITGCVIDGAIGGHLTTLPGNRVGPTIMAVNQLINSDQNATWNGTRVINSAYDVSPRVVPVALFSPAEFHGLDRTSGRFDLTIVNIMGFFVQSVGPGSDVTGVIVTKPDLLGPGPGAPNNAAFLKFLTLVR